VRCGGQPSTPRAAARRAVCLVAAHARRRRTRAREEARRSVGAAQPSQRQPARRAERRLSSSTGAARPARQRARRQRSGSAAPARQGGQTGGAGAAAAASRARGAGFWCGCRSHAQTRQPRRAAAPSCPQGEQQRPGASHMRSSRRGAPRRRRLAAQAAAPQPQRGRVRTVHTRSPLGPFGTASVAVHCVGGLLPSSALTRVRRGCGDQPTRRPCASAASRHTIFRGPARGPRAGAFSSRACMGAATSLAAEWSALLEKLLAE